MEIKSYSLEYQFEVEDRELLESIYNSIAPETRNLPEDCVGTVDLTSGKLIVRFECSSLSKLMALNNSFIGVLTMLLEVVRVVKNE